MLIRCWTRKRAKALCMHHIVCCQVPWSQVGVKREAPEEGQCVHKLAEHGGQLGPPRKHGGLCGETLGGPEPAGGPVCEGPGDAQLPHQRKYIVVLRRSKDKLVRQQAKAMTSPKL